MRKTFIVIGLLLVAMPFLGLPQMWKNTFFVFIGLVLLFLAFFNRRISGERTVSLQVEEETFIETAPDEK